MATKKVTNNDPEEVIEEEKIEEEVIERPYTLRRFKDGDLIPLLHILRKCGFKQFKDAFKKIAEGKRLDVGIAVFLEIADVLIENVCGEAGNDIYNLYASMSDMTVEEIKELEFGTLPLMIYDSFDEVKNTSFFKVLSKLL